MKLCLKPTVQARLAHGLLRRGPMCVALTAITLLGGAWSSGPAQIKDAIPGITNFTRVDATVGCGGATTAAAVPELDRLGYAAIVNLRLPTEQGADVEGERAAAEAAGLTYVHIPFSLSVPDPEGQVDRFLTAVTDEANQPVYIHCASGNRVGSLWFVKRRLVDGWDEARAMREAETIGLANQGLKDFALAYVEAHGR